MSKSDRYRKAQVWIAWINQKEEPEILLFKLIPSRGGAWHPVTGGIEKEESNLEGAQREVKEETGFKAKSGKWIDLNLFHDFDGRWGKVREHAFGLKVDGDRPEPKLDSTEHLEFEWVSAEEALKRLEHGFQRKVLIEFLKRIRPELNLIS